MKIGYTGLELPAGKVKYDDGRVAALVEKHKPKKIVPFFAELLPQELVKCDCVAAPKDQALELVIPDMEKCEQRLVNAESDTERLLLEKCQKLLEQETFLSDAEFNADELKILAGLNFISMKPVLLLAETLPVNEVIKQALNKAKIIFYFTAGPTEVHAWPIKAGSDILMAADKIHSDLARGFIRADIVSFDDYMKCHNMNDAKKQGIAKVVDRDYITQDGDVIEIRFNV